MIEAGRSQLRGLLKSPTNQRSELFELISGHSSRALELEDRVKLNKINFESSELYSAIVHIETVPILSDSFL